jgi:hypothetical protein
MIFQLANTKMLGNKYESNTYAVGVGADEMESHHHQSCQNVAADTMTD